LPYILEKLKGEGGDLILDQTGKLRILLLIILKETDAKWILYLRKSGRLKITDPRGNVSLKSE